MPKHGNYFYPQVQRPYLSEENSPIDLYTAGEHILQGQFLCTENNLAYKANVFSVTKSQIVGIALESAEINNEFKVLTGRGYKINITGLIGGKRYFLGVDGFLIDSPPLDANVVQVGIAKNENELIFEPVFFMAK